MADDIDADIEEIDIEEHDVLDNLKQRKNILLPDITHIKQEVVDYEDESENPREVPQKEYPDIFINPNQEIKTEPVDYEDRDIPNIHRNVIILGSKPSTPQPNPHTSTFSKETSVNCENSREDDDPEILPCDVVLDDWSVHLSNNPCYCSKCQILFPTVNAMDYHRMSAHSFLVAVSNNRAIKSTSKSSLVEYDLIAENLKKNELLCTHCNLYYSDEIALIKHKYSLIPHTCNICKEVFSDEETLKSHQIIHSVEKDLYIVCTICSCVFKREDSYIGHMSMNHGTSRTDRVMAPLTKKCLHCNKHISLPRNFNAHIRYAHEDLFFMKPNGESQSMFQCHICRQTFTSAHSARLHRATKHPSNIKYFNTKYRRVTERTKTNVVKRIDPKHKKIDNNVDIKTLDYKSNLFKKKSDKNVDMKMLVPKSHLFKCNKCQIHFISCSVAIEHSRHCTLSKGDWKCQACRRTFKLDDRQIHIQQHALNHERFKVIVAAEEILPRILNRCGICNICFDERTFAKYHASGCRQSQSVECGVCHLQIHEFAVSKHLKNHRELSLTLNDFIISDYLTMDKPINDENSASTSDALAPVKRRRKRIHSYKSLYFCPNCRCYTSISRKRDGHTTGACKRRTLKELCKLCGLLFTKKAILSHQMYHKMYQMKLTDMTFINILNGRKVLPSFPEFNFCSICRVYFFSSVALKNHVCNTEEHKTCKQCNEKFSDLALKLHLPFHQYSSSVMEGHGGNRSFAVTGAKRYIEGTLTKRLSVSTGGKTPITETDTKRPIPDLIKKYEALVTIWNILYRCQKCDIVLDSYNQVVEHCQDHFCNIKNVNISYCNRCKLKFSDKCYSRHEQLHLENNINIGSFIIIEYDFSVLLQDDWLKIFDRLSKDQIQQILSKSTYNEIRGVRMRLLRDGTLGSIYKCSLCNHCIDVESIVDHVRKKECEGEVKHACTICDIGFHYKNSAIAHKKKHQISDELYRIVSFNESKNAFIDEALIKHTKADDLKFVRCQYCGKLINKNIYRNHIYKHTYVKKMRLLQDKPFKTKEPAVVRHDLKNNWIINRNDQKSTFHFFICKICDVAMTKYTIYRHICSAENKKQKCTKCNLFFRSSNFWKHDKVHEKFPRLSRKTITITYVNKAGTRFGIDIKTDTPNATSEHNAIVENKHLAYDTSTKLIFYQCVFCQSCVYGKNAKKHSCMLGRTRSRCDQCGIVVRTSHLWLHKSLHQKFSFDRNNIKIIKFKGKRIYNDNETSKNIQIKAFKYKTSMKRNKRRIDAVEFSSDTESNTDVFIDHKFDYMRVYKCTSCNLFFTSRYSLLDHIVSRKEACDFEEGTKCENCNLNFHPLNINIHKSDQKCNQRNISSINICTLIFNDSDIQNDSNWIYYCKRCDFYSVNSMIHHMASQHKRASRLIPCTTCGVKFASVCYSKHVRLHHSELNLSFSDLHVEVLEDYTLKEDGDVTQSPDNTLDNSQRSGNNHNAVGIVNVKSQVCQLFRCPICNLHFLTHDAGIQHQHKQQHYAKHMPCTKCNLPFSHASLPRHLKQHDMFKTFNVTDAVVDGYGSKKWKRSIDRSNASLEMRDECTSDVVQTSSASSHAVSTNETSVPTSSNSYRGLTDNINETLSSESPTVPTDEIKQTIDSKSNTVSTDKNKQTIDFKSNTVSTDEIKQTIDSKSNTVSTDEIKQTIDSKSNTLSTDNTLDNTQRSVNNHNAVGIVNVKSQVCQLFRCPICNLHFLTHNAGIQHQHKQQHYAKPMPCTKCNLPFTHISLPRHLKQHHMFKIFNVTDAVVDGYGSKKWKRSIDRSNASLEMSDEDTSDVVQTSSASSHAVSTNETNVPTSSNSYTGLTDNINETLSFESPTVPTDEIKQTIDSKSNTVSTDEIKQTIDSKSNTVSTDEIKQTIDSKSNTVSTDEIKLYKCSECDVYFLTAESCYQHTYNHVPLDPTEYIACKICELQFLCESLGKHMKGHREKTFNMDELVVDEYHPHDINVTIDTYSASDRIKSKLVSTTTLSDND